MDILRLKCGEGTAILGMEKIYIFSFQIEEI